MAGSIKKVVKCLAEISSEYSVYNLNRPFKRTILGLFYLPNCPKSKFYAIFVRYFTPAIFSFVWDCLYLGYCARHQKFFHFIFQAQRQNAINLINVKETVITDTYLMYQTYPQPSPDTEIVYQIITPPKQGVLLLSSSRHMDVLSRGSTGTFISILLLPKILTMTSWVWTFDKFL